MMSYHKPTLSGYVYGLCNKIFSIHFAAQFTMEGSVDVSGNTLSYAWGNLRLTKLITGKYNHHNL